MRSHTDERPFTCSYPGCNKAYREDKHLKQHIKGSHTHEKPYQCDWDGCNKGFLTATRLRRHQESYKGHQGRDRFRCTGHPPCNQTFRKRQTLQRHIRADHLNVSPFPCTYVDPTTQAVCSAGFDSGGSLRKHEDRFHGALRYWCDECAASGASNNEGIPQQAGFRTQNELTRHIRTEHSNCIFCDTKFTSQTQLQRHIETQHASSAGIERVSNVSKPKIPCTIPGCDKTFSKNYNLSVHVRTFHNGERFICSVSATASYSFKSPEVAAWTGIDACGKDFVSKVNLEDHIRTQHLCLLSVVNAKRLKGRSSTGKKAKEASKNGGDLDAINLLTGAGYGQGDNRKIPCLVDDCPRRFIRQYDLEVHLQSKHGISSSDLENGTANIASGPGTYDSNARSNLEDMYDQADLEWDMQRTAVEDDAPFWIGAGFEDDPRAMDSWSMEEAEMRRLIDQDVGFESFVDPALRGL